MAIYEIARPDLPFSPEWKAASDTGRWAPDVRPYTTNRDNNRAVCTRIGGAEQLTYGTPHVLLEALDVEVSKESLLDEVYERERLPALARIPGVRNVVRFRADGAGHPRHVVLYEIDSLAVPISDAFIAADRGGRWSSHVVPVAFNRHFAVYDRTGR
jgi:hypothetical protein